MSYINHGFGLGVRDNQNGEGCDGGKNTFVPYDTRSRDVMGGDYFCASQVNSLSSDDNASTVLPAVEGGNIPGRVALASDIDGTVNFELGPLSAQDACYLRARLDFETGLHANCQ